MQLPTTVTPRKKQIKESHRIGRETRQSERYLDRVMAKCERIVRKYSREKYGKNGLKYWPMSQRQQMKYERLLKPHPRVNPNITEK